MVNKGLATMIGILAVLMALNQSGLVTKDVIKQTLQDNKAWLDSKGLMGNGVLVLVDIVFIVCFFPGSFFLELFCGWMYGVRLGAATILIGKNLAAAICFFLGKTLLSGWVQNLIKGNKAFKSFYQASSASGWQLVLAGRLSPIPSYMCNYGFSATSVSFHDYMLATLLASAPMVVQNVYIGSLCSSIQDVFEGKKGGGDLKDMVFKYGFPFIGTMLIMVWMKAFLAKLADDAETGKLVDSRRASPAKAASSNALMSPNPKRGSVATPRGKSPSARSKSPSARSKSPAAKKTPAKSARSPSPRRTRATPRK